MVFVIVIVLLAIYLNYSMSELIILYSEVQLEHYTYDQLQIEL